MPNKIQRFHKSLNQSRRTIIHDPVYGYAKVLYRRVGGKLQRQLVPYDRYNDASAILFGKQTCAPGATVSIAPTVVKKPSKKAISSSISRLLRGGTISKF